MKKILMKILLVLSVLTIPILVSAQPYNYEDAINRTNAYILEFPDYNDYIKLDNMPYNFENGQSKQSLRFQKGGFLSRDEYQITDIYGSSYLSQGIEYWTLTPQSFNKNHTITYVLSVKLLEEATNVRATSFVKNEAKVVGVGTQNDPWYFVDVVSVNVYSSDANRGTLSLKNCSQKSEGTKTIVVNKYGESNAIFYVCEDRFFRYYKTTCTTNIEKERNSNIAYVKGEINDNTICKIDFAHKTYTLPLGTCTGCSGATPNKIFLSYDRSDYFTDEFGENSFQKLTVLPKKTGYTFGGYKVDDILIIKANGEKSNTSEAKNINITPTTEATAIMTPNNYTVTFNSNGGKTPEQTSKTVTYDSTYGELPAVDRDGYTFAGWYTSESGGNKVTSSTTVKITANQTLYAHWTANSYTISFDANGGNTPNPTSKQVTYDSTYGTLATVTRTGYTFAGWYTAASGGTKIDTSTKVAITAGQTLYAHWTVNNYTVTFNANGGNTPSPTSKTVTYNSTYGTLATVTRTGYDFAGWYTAASSGSQISATSSVKITANQTLYAHWTPKTYSVTFNLNGGESVSQSSKTVTYDSSYGSLPTATRTGYTLAGWYTAASGGTKVDTSTTVKITANQTLYAHWTAKTYTVTFNANGGNTPNPASKSVAYDSTYGTLATVSRTGYTLAGWYTAASGGTKVDTSTTVKITSNQTLYAQWTANSYTVTFNANGGGTPSPASKSVTYASTYGTLATVSRAGYTFAGWYTAASGGTKIETTTKVSITAGQTLYAHWTANSYTVTFNANGGSTPSPQTKSVTHGSTYGTLATTSRSGYEFLGWYTAASGGTKISTSTAVSITAAQTLYAQWKQSCVLPIFTYTGSYQLVTDNDTVIASGTNTKVTIPSGYSTYTGNWKIRFLSSGTITFHELRGAANGIDVFLVGGGGNGGGTTLQQAGRHGYSAAGGGGGGGYRTLKSGVSVSTTSYSITVGAARGASSGFGGTANGGSNGKVNSNYSDTDVTGGAGGARGGNGGYNAADGVAGSAGGCEFNDCTTYSKRYGGGGGGGHAHNGRNSRGLRMPRGVGYPGAGGSGGGGQGNNQWWVRYNGSGTSNHNGTANTGGGGGGASFVFDKYDACGDVAYEYYDEDDCNCWSVNGCFNVSRTTTYPAGTGGSGIVIIRNKR